MIERTCQDCENRPEDLLTTRRQFLNRMGLGFGALSLTSLVGMGLLPPPDAGAGVDPDSYAPLAPRPPHFTPRARRVIQIFASGAPSHIDTWDPKPALDKLNNKSLPGDMSPANASCASGI